jgi:carbonic anhydrase/acetyltransferase-like protein (isoleucine patch superfamily)
LDDLLHYESTHKMTRLEGAYVHSSAQLYGDIRLAETSSVWCNAVLRAESSFVQVGVGTNIQDLVVIHVGLSAPTVVGANCSITHRATLHGCVIGDNVLVGIGATIMDGCRVGANSIIAGHSFLKEGTIIPDNSIVMGIPGIVVRQCDSSVSNRLNAYIYLRNAEAYYIGNHRLWNEPSFLSDVENERARLMSEISDPV